MTRERVIAWNAIEEVWVMTPVELSHVFGIPPGFHIRITQVEFNTISSGIALVIKDEFRQLRKRGDLNEFAQVEEMVVIARDGTSPLGSITLSRGLDAVHSSSTVGGTGFEDTEKKFVQWDIWRDLVFAKNDTGDGWIIVIYYDIVPGEMFWDIFDDSGRFRQIGELEVAAGGIWFQPGNQPGDPDFRVTLGGELD